MTTQTEALKLADELDSEFVQGRISNHTGRKAAQMLRALAQSKETEQETVEHREGFWCKDLTCKKCYSADFRFKHTTPPQRKLPEAGDGHDLFYEAVRILDNAIFAQSGDVVRHDLAAHREALDFFNQVFTRLDLTPPPQRKPLTDEQHSAMWDAIRELGYTTKDQTSEILEIVSARLSANGIKGDA